eukprot:509365_1
MFSFFIILITLTSACNHVIYDYDELGYRSLIDYGGCPEEGGWHGLCHGKLDRIYKTHGLCYKVMDVCWGCLDNAPNYPKRLNPVECDPCPDVCPAGYKYCASKDEWCKPETKVVAYGSDDRGWDYVIKTKRAKCDHEFCCYCEIDDPFFCGNIALPNIITKTVTFWVNYPSQIGFTINVKNDDIQRDLVVHDFDDWYLQKVYDGTSAQLKNGVSSTWTRRVAHGGKKKEFKYNISPKGAFETVGRSWRNGVEIQAKVITKIKLCRYEKCTANDHQHTLFGPQHNSNNMWSVIGLCVITALVFILMSFCGLISCTLGGIGGFLLTKLNHKQTPPKIDASDDDKILRI